MKIMYYCLIAYIHHGSIKETFIVESESPIDVMTEIKSRYPDLEEIRIEGQNFNYISNGVHWSAASYPDDVFINGYQNFRAPAHFNQPFFHILRNFQTLSHV